MDNLSKNIEWANNAISKLNTKFDPNDSTILAFVEAIFKTMNKKNTCSDWVEKIVFEIFELYQWYYHIISDKKRFKKAIDIRSLNIHLTSNRVNCDTNKTVKFIRAIIHTIAESINLDSSTQHCKNNGSLHVMYRVYVYAPYYKIDDTFEFNKIKKQMTGLEICEKCDIVLKDHKFGNNRCIGEYNKYYSDEYYTMKYVQELICPLKPEHVESILTIVPLVSKKIRKEKFASANGPNDKHLNLDVDSIISYE